MKAVITVLCYGLVVSGCAAPIIGWKARPVAAHDAMKTRLWTATGERRFVTWINKGGDRFLLCPEPAPFTGQAIEAASKPKLSETQGLTIGTEESFKTTLSQFGTLTENLSALDRNFANSCNMNVAGYLNPTDLVSEVRADNAVRRIFVLTAAARQSNDPEIKKLVEIAVKEAVEKARKELLTVTVSVSSPAPK
jgi:hypothetical protein